jgi:hypothetical protein
MTNRPSVPTTVTVAWDRSVPGRSAASTVAPLDVNSARVTGSPGRRSLAGIAPGAAQTASTSPQS